MLATYRCELWDRVKARQLNVRASFGKLVRGGQRKTRAGSGRPSKHLFSGLMVCSECGASMVLRNRQACACASHCFGAACTNTLNVSRHIIQAVVMGGIREDLQDPAVVDELERRFKLALRSRGQVKAPDNARRIAQLEREIENMTGAIAKGLVSAALAGRLREWEDELCRLTAAPPSKRAVALVVPNVRERFSAMASTLDHVLLRDPERGREELRGILGGEKIKCVPDESGRFLWADYALGFEALLPRADKMVAGA